MTDGDFGDHSRACDVLLAAASNALAAAETADDARVAMAHLAAATELLGEIELQVDRRSIASFRLDAVEAAVDDMLRRVAHECARRDPVGLTTPKRS